MEKKLSAQCTAIHNDHIHIPIGRILDLLLVDARNGVATLAPHLARPRPPADRVHVVVQIVGLRLIVLGTAATGRARASAAGIAARRGFPSGTHALEVLAGRVHRDHLGGVSATGK